MHQVTDDFPLLQWWPCSWLTEDCQVLPSSFSSCHPPVGFEPATPGKRGRSPILPTKLRPAVTHPITNAAILLNLSDLRGSHSGTFPLVTGKSSGGDHPWYPVCHNLWSWCFRTDDMSRTSWTEGTSPILDHGRVVKASPSHCTRFRSTTWGLSFLLTLSSVWKLWMVLTQTGVNVSPLRK